MMKHDDGRHYKVPGAVPVLSWATFHGLDPVWARIGQEGILKVGFNIVKREADVFDTEFPNCPTRRLTRQPL